MKLNTFIDRPILSFMISGAILFIDAIDKVIAQVREELPRGIDIADIMSTKDFRRFDPVFAESTQQNEVTFYVLPHRMQKVLDYSPASGTKTQVQRASAKSSLRRRDIVKAEWPPLLGARIRKLPAISALT